MKKRPGQKRRYPGPRDKDGDLLKKPVRKQTIVRSPSYGPYHVMWNLARGSGLDAVLEKTYGERDGKRLLGLAILVITDPGSGDLLEESVEDTCLRELMGMDWSFEQSEVCRFLQRMGEDAGRGGGSVQGTVSRGGVHDLRHRVFGYRFGGSGISGGGTQDPPHRFRAVQSRHGAFREGRAAVLLPRVSRLRGGRRHPGRHSFRSEEDGMRFLRDGHGQGVFSTGNVELMLERSAGFTVPVPAGNGIRKLLISNSAKDIEFPLNTDYPGGSSVRGYETGVVLEEGGSP